MLAKLPIPFQLINIMKHLHVLRLYKLRRGVIKDIHALITEPAASLIVIKRPTHDTTHTFKVIRRIDYVASVPIELSDTLASILIALHSVLGVVRTFSLSVELMYPD